MKGLASRGRAALVFCSTAALMGGCDLSTKTWAQSVLSSRPGQSLTVVDPWVEFSLAYNRGTAFSLIPKLGAGTWVFALLALVACAVLFMMAIRRPLPRPAMVVALAVVAGGAIGNGWDRAFRVTPAGDTAVIDFVRVNLTSSYSWPTFNLADVWIVVGVAWFLWLGHRAARSGPDAQAAPSPAGG